ncbi:hypothetical protein AKJ16_DCAP23387 [Drosera capensis]
MSGGDGVGEVVVVGCQVPSLPPPRPRSPPPYPDLYGKRRELAKLQMLERDKGFLEEESNLPILQAMEMALWIMELLYLMVLLLQRVLLSSEAADLQLLFSMRLQPLQLLLLLLSKVAMLFVSYLPWLLHDEIVPEKQLQIQAAFMFEIQLLRMRLLLP